METIDRPGPAVTAGRSRASPTGAAVAESLARACQRQSTLLAKAVHHSYFLNDDEAGSIMIIPQPGPCQCKPP